MPTLSVRGVIGMRRQATGREVMILKLSQGGCCNLCGLQLGKNNDRNS